jgi:hypothetical protein
MTPHTIAYVAIQVCRTILLFFPSQYLTYDAYQARFAMSSTSTWANIDGPFSYSDFYWRIVGLFEDEEEAAGLIKFYNQYVPLFITFMLLIVFILCSHVFGTVLEPDGGQIAAAEDDIEDEYETVRRQRSAKRARNANQRSGSHEV